MQKLSRNVNIIPFVLKSEKEKPILHCTGSHKRTSQYVSMLCSNITVIEVAGDEISGFHDTEETVICCMFDQRR